MLVFKASITVSTLGGAIMTTFLKTAAATATSPVTGARALVPEPLNFNADWRITSETANEVVLTNINVPVNCPEIIRVAFTEIADVFKGTKINPQDGLMTAGSLDRRGASILVQLSGGLWADEQVGENAVLYPYSAHLVVKVPVGIPINGATVWSILQKMFGALYETKATLPDTRVASLLRGALTPIDL